MGFTLKAAIDNLPADAEVVVAELNPIMVNWCRGPIAHLTGSARAGAGADMWFISPEKRPKRLKSGPRPIHNNADTE